MAVLLALQLQAAHVLADKKKPGLFDFQPWKTPQGHQRDAIQQLAPHQLDLTPADDVPAGGSRPLRVRIYADRDYRAMTLHWKRSFTTQLERVNRVLEPVFNVRLEIESMREWPSSHAGARLEAILEELEHLDGGREADWTIALVTPFKGVATSIHQLGQAVMLGHFFVMRGMDDEQEGLALDREFGLLSPDDRARMYGDRKTHKETVVFLHEWGHTLGALHAEDEPAIMHPQYDAKRRAFSHYQKRLLSFVLERRLAVPGEAHPERDGLAAILAEAPSEEGGADERARLMEFATARGRPAPARGAGAGSTGGGGSGAAVRVTTDDDTTDKTTAAVAEQLDAAAAAGRAGDTANAVTQLNAVLARLSEKDAKGWARAATLAMSLGAFSLADVAFRHLARGADSQTLIEKAEHQRALLALPHVRDNWGLRPEDEVRYAAHYQAIAQSLSKAEAAAARARLAEFARAFPAPPGAQVLACDLELAARRTSLAVRECEAALKKSDHLPRAHYLLGLLAAQQHQDAAAEQHLRRAILLDPLDDGAWRELARLYRSTRSTSRLADLEQQHRSLRHAPLPP